MAVKIDSSRLAATINSYLEEYGDQAIEAIETSSKKVGKEVVKDLKKGGRFGGTGEFNKGWTSKTEKTRLGGTTFVYNKSQPGLAHLLEFGHAKMNGGRTTAYNFIAPVNDSVEDKFVKAFEEAIGG